MKALKVLALTKYGRLGASSRLRFLQYMPGLAQAGLCVSVQPLLSDAHLQMRYEHGRYGISLLFRSYAMRWRSMMTRHQFDLLWIEKEALPWAPVWLERALLSGVPYVLDYDDAVFHAYDQHPNSLVRRVYGRRLDRLMADAALVVAGNNYLAKRAHDAGSLRVEVLPTVVDMARYCAISRLPADRSCKANSLRIVWIGSPSTVHYLKLLREPLQALAVRHRFTLRVIGGAVLDIPGVSVEVLPWSEDSEVEDISACDVGVMPLLDSSWEQGKCGYKLIQYMACGLPVVASNVGVNPEIVQHGDNGFLVRTPDEWVLALGQLLESESLRTAMGLAGRERVAYDYCTQKTGPRLAELLRSAAMGL